MPKRVATETVRRTLIGEARQQLTDAAGSNTLLSKAEQETLAPDLQAAAGFARNGRRTITVNDVVDNYAGYVSRVLAAVDTRGKGMLSKTESNKIENPQLKAKVFEIRARVLGGDVAQPGGVSAALASTVDEVATEWGDNNIMDGIVRLALLKAPTGAEALAVAEFERLIPDDDVTAFHGARSVETRPLSAADAQAIAIALNDDGFQYAQRDAVPGLKRQVADIIKKLGGPTGLEVSVVKQRCEPSHLDLAGDTLPAQLWVISNPDTGDAARFTVIKGTL